MLFPAGESRDFDFVRSAQCVDDVFAPPIGIGPVLGASRQVHMPAETPSLRQDEVPARLAGPRVEEAAATSRPNASNTLATIALASRPALAYIAAGLSCSMNRSGRTSD